MEGGSGLEVPVKSPYIRLVEVNADTESRSWSLCGAGRGLQFSLPVGMKLPEGSGIKVAISGPNIINSFILSLLCGGGLHGAV